MTPKSKTSEYAAWGAMIQRCTNPKNPVFMNYGGRGIRVCDRWRSSFDDFVNDMGPRPTPAHSLDRVNNDGDYEPANCRWADSQTQRLNQRRPAAAREQDMLSVSVPRSIMQKIDALHRARVDGADKAQVIRELLARAVGVA